MTGFLAQHRHMPSSPRGQSPALLLLGQNTHMSFELPAEATSSLSGTLSGTGMLTKGGKIPRGAGAVVDPKGVSGPISGEKDWIRLWPQLQPGELVLIHAGPVSKSTSRYKGPLKVDKVLGRYTFQLSDGQC